VACSRSLLQTSFAPSTLVYWRKRIAACDRPDRVFDAVAEVIAQTGILRGRRKRCVDSTVFDDAVATQGTVTQLVTAIRKQPVPADSPGLGVVRRLGLRQRGGPSRLPRRRPRHRDQAQAAAPRRGRRLHPRRLHPR
jgi:hypothetical protein